MRYKRIKNNQLIDTQAVLTQAIQLLDIASLISLDSNDIDLILSVFDKWLEFASALSEDEIEYVDVNQLKLPYGFSSSGREVDDDDN